MQKFLLAVLLFAEISSLRISTDTRPWYTHYAQFARWMSEEASWGVMATSGDSIAKEGFHAPFANVVAFAQHKGAPLLYLSALDPTGSDLEANPNASIALSEASFGQGCHFVSAEEPTCARLTLSGIVLPVGPDELEASLEVIFKKHPSMRVWPRDHNFKVFKMQLKHVFLVNFYGGAPHVSVEDYLKAT